MLVLQQVAFDVPDTHHGNAEDHRIVLEGFPPHGGAGAGNLCTHGLADFQRGIGNREAVRI
jgi:hypothetical protein